ncbi:MAG: DMT family transporter [Verrucomicrobia bacterium]|nr:DMT family transporter [Verrucomicrobiota bacterium]
MNDKPIEPIGNAEHHTRGVVLAVFSTALVATNYVTAKIALGGLNLETFFFLWFGAASVLSVGHQLANKRLQFFTQLIEHWRALVPMAALGAVSNLLFFAGIGYLDPAISAISYRTELIFSVLLGIVTLKERLNRMEWCGFALVVAGLAAIYYRGGAALTIGALVMVVSAFIGVVSNWLAKRTDPDVEVGLMVAARCLGSLALAAIYVLATRRFNADVPALLLAMVGVGALMGPFLSFVCYFAALRYMDFSKVSILRNSEPVFAAVYGFVFLGSLPVGRQLVGCVLVLAGVLLVALFRPGSAGATDRSATAHSLS